MKLKSYRKKRILARTPEPGPAPGRGEKEPHLVFAVHRHAASRLHYDLRLELGGVLKSFAVPKGPSLDPAVKRLAVMVEDHPYAYKDFEGVIPEGNYGAGSVMLWDRGFYGFPGAAGKKESEKALLAGLKKGDFKFVLAGSKLKGEFALVKTRWDAKAWLLLKKKDQYASAEDILAHDRSVFSDRTQEEIAAEARGSSSVPKETAADILNEAPKGAMPHKVEPMLASSVNKPFRRADWLFEVKWDGYRAIAETGKRGVRLYSRNQLSLADRFPAVAEALRKFGEEAVLDGEIVAVDKDGVPGFQLLQDHRKTGRGYLIYYVFDILFYRGRDLTGLPLIRRKELLKSMLPAAGHIRYSEHVTGNGVSFFGAAKKKGLEGIVAKYSKSAYLPGARSRHWLKIKNRATLDCVIAGFTGPRGTGRYFGSLVLGAYRDGELVHVGSSGGGAGGAEPGLLYKKLLPLKQKACPFKTPPAEAMPVTWLKPALVCEVAFTERTRDGLLRQPVFLRLREDKPAREAVLEDAPDFAGDKEREAT